jgi:hypothetical protein
MSALGKSVIEAIDFLASFYRDLSKLFICVEGLMSKHGLVDPWGSSGSFWDTSSSYLQPTGWMPRYLFRLYAPPALPSKTKNPPTRTAFFAAYLAPTHPREPMAVWGVIEGPDASILESADSLFFSPEGPPFLTSSLVAEWAQVADLPTSLRSLVYRAVAIVDLKGSTEVERLVVGPLIQRLTESAGRL